MDKLERWIWTPLDYQREIYKVNEALCRFMVHETYGVGFRQCYRKPMKTMQGYGLCTQHANFLAQRGFDG
jgi:hypothetical protein